MSTTLVRVKGLPDTTRKREQSRLKILEKASASRSSRSQDKSVPATQTIVDKIYCSTDTPATLLSA